MINKINFSPIKKINYFDKKPIYLFGSLDTFFTQDMKFDKKVLISRGIIGENQSLDIFFNDVSNKIFNQTNKDFIQALKNTEITLSTNAYGNLNHPQSAVAIKLDKNKSDASHFITIDEQVRNGLGIGINFSDFDNPVHEVLKINSYLKYLEPKTKRPPAAIGLLDINHPDVVDFIKLKNNADYKNWCMNLSVIIDDNFMQKLKNKDKKASDIYALLLDSMKKSGEPGVIFSNDRNYICDCCAAASLKNNEQFTIGHLNLSEFFKNDKIDYKKLKKDTEVLCSAMQRLDKNSYIGVLGYQDLLKKTNMKYGSNEALEIIEPIMKIIQTTAHNYNLKTAISPTGNISRFLKTTPSIEPDESNYIKEINTMAKFQKYIDGNISKTILLNKNSTVNDIDAIIKLSYESNLKGITVY